MTVIDAGFSGTLSTDINDYPEGIVVVVDKPYRWTSADVIRKLKFAAIRHFGKRNLKVGHAGTLDPLATGVLLVCIGNACKRAMEFQAGDKEYVAGVCFGATTPSYDMEKDIDRTFPIDKVSKESVQSVLPAFLGEQDQVAPLFSAKQVDGRRAYDLARRMLAEGKPLDEAADELLQVNHICIHYIELESYGSSTGLAAAPASEGTGGASSRINVASLPDGLPVATVRVSCSKGTYIRALARDMGERLDSGAFLCSLRRSACGAFRVENAATVEKAVEILQ